CQTVKAEIACGVLLRARHDVPSDPSFADMVEGRGAPRKLEGMALENRTGEGQPEMLRIHGQRGEKHRGIITWNLKAFADIDLIISVHRPIQPHDIGEEHCIEQAKLESLRQFDPNLDIVEISLLCLGMPPQPVLNM